MDLSKAFDTLPHDLIVKKLKDFGGDSKVISLITNYLSDRQQRVRLSGQHSSMKTTMRGVPQGSILGPILLHIFMNGLSMTYAIDGCTLFTYADDTEDIDQVEHVINADLKKVDEWYEFNQMQRNHSKYQAITLGRVERNPVLTCKGTVIPTQDEMELVGFTIDTKLKFEGQIRKICRKVSEQIAVLNLLKKILPFELSLGPVQTPYVT